MSLFSTRNSSKTGKAHWVADDDDCIENGGAGEVYRCPGPRSRGDGAWARRHTDECDEHAGRISGLVGL